MDKSARIRTSAAKLFASHGYEGVSLQTIADDVGVAKQTLLYHYPSKDALRKAVLEQVFEHWRKTLPQILEAVTSGERRYTALTEELIRFFSTDRDRARLLARELLDNPHGTQRLMAQHLRPWLLLIAEYIREGQKLGVIHAEVDAESYVLHVIVLVVANVANLATMSGVLAHDAPAKARALAEERHLGELVRLTRSSLFTR